MAPSPIHLGPFRLLRPMARGGMAEVWRAEHVDGAAVAVKVLSPHGDNDPTLARMLRREIEAVAGLDHPAIALVLDHGTVTDAATRASDKRLVAGSPWFAMELASGGPLAAARGPLTWPQARHVLRVVLEALAHAHARGVVHRDLKPANVLICTEEDARPGLKLTDFGMAGRLDDAQGEAAFAGGTPRYMAPEQFRAEHHLIGPWTDLYSLGCLTHTLLAGRAPFADKTWRRLAKAHALEEPPALRSAHAVPPGLAAWVERLLHKRPMARYRRAADALEALVQLDGDPEFRGPLDPRTLPEGLKPGGIRPLETSGTRAKPPARKAVPSTPAASEAMTQRRSPKEPASAEDSATTLEPSAPTVSFVAADLPPQPPGAVPTSTGPKLPADWQRAFVEELAAPGAQLFGAGLSLFGVRSPPLVGREQERGTLWRALHAVHEEQAPRVVVLRGAAGAGKSRLAAWLCERADEVGGAIALRAQHGRTAGPTDGLQAMVARHLNVFGLPRDVVRRRVWSWHSDRGLTHLVDPDVVTALTGNDRPGDGKVTLRSADERQHALLSFIACAVDRPAIVWLDDVQWGPEALALAARALELRPDERAPALFVLTVRTEPDARVAGLEELLAHERAELIELRGLDEQVHLDLLRSLLPLDRHLAEELALRTKGNPLFAVQLVADQVTRGAFVLGRGGYQLPRAEDAPLPDDLHALWVEQTARLVGESTAWRDAIELAATLGEHVDGREWRGVTRAAGVDDEALESLTARLVRDGLALRTDEGWSFVHGMLRESLERTATAAGRWRECNSLVAAALHELWGGDSMGVAARRGSHLVAAGEYSSALPELLTGARELLEQADLRGAQRVLDAWDDAAQLLGVADDDVRRAHAEMLRIRALAMGMGSVDEAIRRTRAAQQRARLPAWAGVLPEALRLRGVLAYRQAHFEHARRLFQEAFVEAERSGDEECQLAALLGTADVNYYQAMRDEAARTYRRALRIADHRGDVRQAGRCLWSLGCVECWRGKLERAEQLFRRQTELMEREGDRLSLARGLSSLGECLRLQERLEEAEACFARSLTTLQEIGSRATTVVEMNLATVKLDAGDVAAARPILERLVDDLERASESPASWIGALLLARCAALEGQWREVDARLNAVLAEVEEAQMIEGDIGEQLHQIGVLALQAGHTGRAKRALLPARRQWQGTGWTARAAVVDALLDQT